MGWYNYQPLPRPQLLLVDTFVLVPRSLSGFLDIPVNRHVGKQWSRPALASGSSFRGKPERQRNAWDVSHGPPGRLPGAESIRCTSPCLTKAECLVVKPDGTVLKSSCLRVYGDMSRIIHPLVAPIWLTRLLQFFPDSQSQVFCRIPLSACLHFKNRRKPPQ